MQTFNEFFIRELKPGARPISFVGRDDIAVCAADSRLMAFSTAEESLRFWIKVSLTICNMKSTYFLSCFFENSFLNNIKDNYDGQSNIIIVKENRIYFAMAECPFSFPYDL